MASKVALGDDWMEKMWLKLMFGKKKMFCRHSTKESLILDERVRQLADGLNR